MNLSPIKAPSPLVASLIVVIIGLFLMSAGVIWPELNINKIDVSYLFSNLGLYLAIVVSAQWYYDNHTKNQLLIEVSRAAIAYTQVARSGISNFMEKTRDIKYDEIFAHPETITIGFQHNPRIVDAYYAELESRVKEGRKTRILISNPSGIAVKYLVQSIGTSDHVKTDINKIIAKIHAINQIEDAKEKLQVRFHDAVLTYSFVFFEGGAWIKSYRNSLGKSSTPGIFVRNASPLFEFYKTDVESLWELASNENT